MIYLKSFFVILNIFLLVVPNIYTNEDMECDQLKDEDGDPVVCEKCKKDQSVSTLLKSNYYSSS